MVQQGLIHVRRREIWHFLNVFGVHKYLLLFCTTDGKGQMNFEPRRKWSLVVQLFIASRFYFPRIFTFPYWLIPLCLFGVFFPLSWSGLAQLRVHRDDLKKTKQNKGRDFFLWKKRKTNQALPQLMQLLKCFYFSNVSDIWSCWIQARYTRTSTDLFNRVCKWIRFNSTNGEKRWGQ